MSTTQVTQANRLKDAAHAQKGATHALHGGSRGAPRIDSEQANACAKGDERDV
jgi:hypothetical protein